jgi:hypothetical protein
MYMQTLKKSFYPETNFRVCFFHSKIKSPAYIHYCCLFSLTAAFAIMFVFLYTDELLSALNAQWYEGINGVLISKNGCNYNESYNLLSSKWHMKWHILLHYSFNLICSWIHIILCTLNKLSILQTQSESAAF